MKRTVICGALENGGQHDRFKTDASSVFAVMGWMSVPSTGAR